MSELILGQFLSARAILIEVDGSAVTTTPSSAGLLAGAHQVLVSKGTSADSNLVTFTFKQPFGFAPKIFIQEITLDCIAREEATPTKNGFQVRTLELDATTKEDDANFSVIVVGSNYNKDGDYRRV